MKPELLNERLKTLAPIIRTDVKRIDKNIALDILKEKGLIKEGQKTIFDYFKCSEDNEEQAEGERE